MTNINLMVEFHHVVKSLLPELKFFLDTFPFFMGRPTVFLNDVQERLNHVKFGTSIVFLLRNMTLLRYFGYENFLP